MIVRAARAIYDIVTGRESRAFLVDLREATQTISDLEVSHREEMREFADRAGQDARRYADGMAVLQTELKSARQLTEDWKREHAAVTARGDKALKDAQALEARAILAESNFRNLQQQDRSFIINQATLFWARMDRMIEKLLASPPVGQKRPARRKK